MVRGNWQRRVERTEARRAEAKSRKQARENRSRYKQMVQELMGVLNVAATDRQQQQSQRTLHVWIDTMPSDSSPIVDYWEDKSGGGGGGSKNNRRNRSGSFQDSDLSKGGRKRSGSFQEQATNNSKKKAHPRSKEAFETTEQDDPNRMMPKLCRKQFFTGKCHAKGGGGGGGSGGGSGNSSGSNKRGGCKHMHFPKRQLTLGQVLLPPKPAAPAKQLAQQVEKAYLETNPEDSEESTGGMDMLYYFSLEPARYTAAPNDDNVDDNDAHEPPSFPTYSSMLSSALSDKSCGIASVVYLCLNDTLIFDRHQGGLRLHDLPPLLGRNKRRTTSVGSEHDNEVQRAHDLADFGHIEATPEPLLEHICSFLPDEAVPTMSMVCHGWSQIGKHSPELWRMLLSRRGWPIPETTEQQTVSAAFRRHSLILRDIRAAVAGYVALTTTTSMPTTTSINSKGSNTSAAANTAATKDGGNSGGGEMVLQQFSTRRLAPQQPNQCVALRVWGERSVLAAYHEDCTIRLFQVTSSNSSGADRTCREMVSVCVDPYYKTRRQTSRILAMDIDNDVIGCLLEVTDHWNNDKTQFLLASISRDDFLCADSSSTNNSLGYTELDEGVLKVIDIREAIVHAMMNKENLDYRLLILLDFVNSNGEQEQVHVGVSTQIVACGYGQFLVEVSTSFRDFSNAQPYDDLEDLDIPTVVGRKFVLFSSTAGVVTWMGDHDCPNHSPQDGMQLVGWRFPGTRPGCRVAIAQPTLSSSSSSLSSSIWVGEIVAVGAAFEPTFQRMETAVSGNEGVDTTDDEWLPSHAPMTQSESEVIQANVVFKELVIQVNPSLALFPKVYRSSIHFFPILDPLNSDTLELPGDCQLLMLENIREGHLLALCRIRRRPLSAPGPPDPDLNELDGHWFFDEPVHDDVRVKNVTLEALVIHAPTRTVLERYCLKDGVDNDDESIPIAFCCRGNTVAFGIDWKGIVMTGQDVRGVGDSGGEITTPGKSQKKKKKKRPWKEKNSKKDGFARGMSMRG